MAEGAVAPAVHDDDLIGSRLATVGAAGLALSFGAVVALAGLPFFRIVGLVLGLLMALMAVGLWRRWPGAIVLGIIVGGLAVGFGLPALLGAGDDVYEQVPSVWSAVTPALAFGLGAMVLIGGLASVVPAGRVGRVVAVVLVVLGIVVAGLGARRMLEHHEVRGPGPAVDCGTVFRPAPNGPNQCWGKLGPARGDARSMLSWGAVLVFAGLGLLPTQFGRRAWLAVAVASGAAAIGVAWIAASMPLQSNSCRSSNEAYTGPVCDGLRHGLTGVTILYAALGVVLVVGGLLGAAGPALRVRRA
jgi:hypothetical protein